MARTVWFRRRIVPTAEQILGLVERADSLLKELRVPTSVPPTPWHVRELKAIEDGLTDIKARIPMKDAKVDEDEWPKKTEATREAIYWELADIIKAAGALNASSIRAGRVCFFVLAGLLLALALGYVLCWHKPIAPSDLSMRIVEIDRLVDALGIRRVEKQTADAGLKGAEENVRKAEQGEKAARERLTAAGQDKATAAADLVAANESKSKAQADLKQQLDAGRKAMEEFAKAAAGLRDKAIDLGVQVKTLEQISGLLVPVDVITLPEAVKLAGVKSAVNADLGQIIADNRVHGIQRRWLEIAWWAEFGALVGLLFYIAGLLSDGLFREEELPTFCAEIIAAPLVVPVVFFLWKYTAITTSSDTSSITVDLGLAFILGFAIRRTVGLLDFIKKKVLPDPDLAASKTAAKPASGAANVTVPALIGKTRADAEAALKAAGLQGRAAYVVGKPGAAVDTVVEQGTSTGTSVAPATTVGITLNGIAVPNLIGKTKEAAERDLTALDLRLGDASRRVGDPAQPGVVVEQSPAAGAPAGPKDPVAIVLGSPS